MPRMNNIVQTQKQLRNVDSLEILPQLASITEPDSFLLSHPFRLPDKPQTCVGMYRASGSVMWFL